MVTIKGMIDNMVLYNYVSLVALLAALYYYIRYRRTFPLIIPFLFVNNFMEIFLVYYFGVVHKNNLLVFNYLCVIIILHYFYIYYNKFKEKSWSKYIVLTGVLWSIYTTYLVISYDPFSHFYNSYVIGLIITLVLIFLFLRDVINGKEFLDLKRYPLFYFSMGIVFFTVSSFPMLIFSEPLFIFSNSNMINILIQLSNIFLNIGYLGTVIYAGRNNKTL